MREWFGRFPAGAETRDDVCLLRPRLPGLAVELRRGRVLELKALVGGPEPVELPYGRRGTLELWRKWSFSGDDCPPGDGGGDARPGAGRGV